jgi:hypothetical protein
MHEPQDIRTRELARENALYRYIGALERGGFDIIAAVLRQAEYDPVLEQMILGVNEEYQREYEVLQHSKVFALVNTTGIPFEKHAWNGVPEESKTSHGHPQARDELIPNQEILHQLDINLRGYLNTRLSELGVIGVIRSHSLKIAFNIKRLSVSRRDENRF